MRKFFSTLLLTVMICAPMSLSAQITIGSGNAPSEWSLLDLDNRGQTQPKALHLPRMNSADRDALAAPVPHEGYRRELERGLMIFNTQNNCVEFWNGEQWVSLCEGDITQPNPVSHWVPEGGTHTFTLGAATGGTGTFTYQWQSSPDGTTGWVDIPNGTGQHLTVPVFTENTHRFYRRVAISSNPRHYSNVAEITVWARFNVDTPGTFTQTMCGLGRHFQWGTYNNTVHHFPATGSIPLGTVTWYLDYPNATGAKLRRPFTEENTPCPPGWRLPTRAEFDMLAGARWAPWSPWQTNWNNSGVDGVLFESSPNNPNNQLFFPVARSRSLGLGASPYPSPFTHVVLWAGTWDCWVTTDGRIENSEFWSFYPGGMSGTNCGNMTSAKSLRCVLR